MWVVQSEGVLVGNRQSLLQRPGLLPMLHELLERLEAHLTANSYYSVVCNMRGGEPEQIAADMRAAGVGGLQGPTLSKVHLLLQLSVCGAWMHGWAVQIALVLLCLCLFGMLVRGLLLHPANSDAREIHAWVCKPHCHCLAVHYPP